MVLIILPDFHLIASGPISTDYITTNQTTKNLYIHRLENVYIYINGYIGGYHMFRFKSYIYIKIFLFHNIYNPYDFTIYLQ